MFNKLKLTAVLIVLIGTVAPIGCESSSENGSVEPAGVNNDAEKEVENEELEKAAFSKDDFTLNMETLYLQKEFTQARLLSLVIILLMLWINGVISIIQLSGLLIIPKIQEQTCNL